MDQKLEYNYCFWPFFGSLGICMEEDDKMSMLGLYSEDLHYVGRQLFLTYENGRFCSGREFYQAEIAFMCRNEYFPRNGPQYVGSIGCRHMFMFYTTLESYGHVDHTFFVILKNIIKYSL